MITNNLASPGLAWDNKVEMMKLYCCCQQDNITRPECVAQQCPAVASSLRLRLKSLVNARPHIRHCQASMLPVTPTDRSRVQPRMSALRKIQVVLFFAFLYSLLFSAEGFSIKEEKRAPYGSQISDITRTLTVSHEKHNFRTIRLRLL